MIQSKKTAQTISNVKEGVLTAFIGVGAVGIGVAGYAFYEWVTGSSLLSNLTQYKELEKQRAETFKDAPKGGVLNPVLPWWFGPLRF